MFVSVAVAAWDYNGYGTSVLDKLLKSCVIQTYKHFEVVVSDHSVGDEIKVLCESYKKSLNILWTRNTKNRGISSANTNNAISYCSGDTIKILCQDDYFTDENSIQNTVNSFNGAWLVSAYHMIRNKEEKHFSTHYPKVSTNIRFINLIGTHSCLSFSSGIDIKFDENLIWYMDSDFYAKLFNIYGLPIVLNIPTVTQLLWDQQVTNTLATEAVKEKEKKYLEEIC